MNKKGMIAAVVGLTLILGATGCAKKEAAQPPAQNSTGQVSPTPQTQAKPVDANKVADNIYKLIDKKYPGDWKANGTTLSKGNYTENGKYEIAAAVGAAYPGSMVSIFIGQDRISSTVINQQTGKPVLTGYPTPPQVLDTMKSGKVTSGTSSGMGSGMGSYQKIYVPFKSGDKTVAVLTISVQ